MGYLTAPFVRLCIAMDNGRILIGTWETMTFVEGIPEDISALFLLHCRPGILVLDDLMRNCSGDERICLQKCLIIATSPTFI